MALTRKPTAILFYCPTCKSLQVMDYLILNPNISLTACQNCNTQYKMDSTFTLTQPKTTDNANMAKINSSEKITV